MIPNLNLKVKALKRGKCHVLTIPQKEARVITCRALLKRYAKKSFSVLVKNEEILTIVEYFKKQDRMYA